MLLSVCILMKGGAENLRRLAAMVKPLADELLIVCDDPVSEAFQDAASQYNARLVPHRWQNDFSTARNAGLQAAQGEWVFWIDSDETLLSPDAPTFHELLGRTDILGYFVTIEDLKDGATMSPRQHLSLYRQRKEIRYVGRIHEHFEPPLEILAARWGMTVSSSPVRLRHTGYEPQFRVEKLRRNIALLERELADRPGQLYYLIELGRSLLLSGQSRGHAILAEAAETLRPSLSHSQPPNPLVAALLEYALSHAPAGFPLSRAAAVAAAARWFPSSPPLAWRAARWHYEQEQIAESAELLRRVLEMGGSKNYDDTISFDQRIFGDETHLNLGVCCAKLGQYDKALEQFKLIKAGSPFFEMAKKNIGQLERNRE
jgi:tetratricopeptide (TPR) repeat protein